MCLRNVIRHLALTVLICAAQASFATQMTVSGYFDDPTNTALISSNGYGDLGPAQFAPDGDVTRNVAVYQLVVPVDGSAIEFVSSGYADGGGQANGGAQPYFSIFSGGDGTATFLDSSFDDPNYDFSVSETLAQGTYLFTIGVYENQSSAENAGPPYGSLSEGFTALGVPQFLGDAFYQVSVMSDDAAFTVGPAALTAPTNPTNPTNPNNVPEPSLFALLAIGLAGFTAARSFHPIKKGIVMFIARSFYRRTALAASTAMLVAVVGLVAPLDASAQARPAITRDTDNPDLAPAFFSGTFNLNTVANTTITTVPAGKRLVIDNVSYFYAIATSGDQLNEAYLYVYNGQSTQVRLYFPINPPHAYGSAAGSAAQDASFAGRTYFEAGEVVKFVGGTTISDSSRTINLSITGHYVTP